MNRCDELQKGVFFLRYWYRMVLYGLELCRYYSTDDGDDDNDGDDDDDDNDDDDDDDEVARRV